MPVAAVEMPDPAEPDDESTPAPPAELLLVACYDESFGYSAHRAEGARNWLVTWTLAGAGRFTQGDASTVARPGDLVVLGPDVPHAYGVAPGADRWGFWWAHCPARPAWLPLLAPYEIGGRCYVVAGVPPAVHGRIEDAFRRLYADARWSGHGAPPAPVDAGLVGSGLAAGVASGVVGSVGTAGPVIRPALPAVAAGVAARELASRGVDEVVLLATATAESRTHPDPVGDPVDQRVRRVESLLIADPAAPHTVESLAAQVALSPSRFAHLFAAQTGRTPIRALREARLTHAARLLEATDLPVAAVAAASGFASAFHFSRAFRARYGVPPRDYREGRHAAGS